MGALYTEEQRARGQRAMILEGVFSRMMEGVTGGVILAGFALALGASDLEIGIVAAIPFLAQLAHIPGVALLRRFTDRKPFVVWMTIVSRSIFFLIATLPFLGLARPVTLLAPLLGGYAVVATLAGAGWQVWIRSLVPREKLGAYFGRRMSILSFVGLLTLVAAGQFVSGLADPMLAYSILFAFGGVVGLVSSALLTRAPSVRDEPPRARPLGETLRAPLADTNYRGLLVFLGAWGFAANIALPFVSVVLLRVVGYSVVVVTLFAALSQVSNIASLRLWAPLTDRYGNKPVLGLSASVFVFAMLVWALTPKVPGTGLVVATTITHVLLGFAIAGLDVASNNITLKLATEDDAPSFLASASVVKALAAGVAPLVGGLVATALAGRTFRFQLAWESLDGSGAITYLRLGPHDVLFAASVVLGLYAIHRLLGFKEQGEAPPEDVMRAMRRDVSQISSVAGMRTFAHVASYVVEATYRVEKAIVPAGLVEEKRPPGNAP